LNSDLDVYKIINNSSMVISMPFTSTALIAQELGKPTIFYDPSSRLFKDDPAAHGIQVISSVVDLEKWVVSNLRISQLKF
jgi:polysaccharide biosynthesis PFTS motif protein